MSVSSEGSVKITNNTKRLHKSYGKCMGYGSRSETTPGTPGSMYADDQVGLEINLVYCCIYRHIYYSEIIS